MTRSGFNLQYKTKKSQSLSRASQLGLSEEERLQVGPAGVSEAACPATPSSIQFHHAIHYNSHIVIIRITIVIIEKQMRCNQL